MKNKKHKNIIYSFAIVAILFLGGGCKDEFSSLRFDSDDKMQIYDYAALRPDLSIYKDLLDYTNFSSIVSTAGNYTVFIPTNTAFQELFEVLGIEGIEDQTDEYWLDYLKYQSMDYKMNTNTMENGALDVPTLLGEEYYIVADIRESYKAIKLNSRATIDEYNIEVANGYINITDKVLLPPTTSIYDMLEDDGNFTKMLAIFESTGLSAYLKDSVVTVVIETDAILERDGFDPTVMSNTELSDWAKYHIIEKRRMFDADLDGQSIYSLFPDEALSFSVEDNGKMWMNEKFAFSQTLVNGINNVAANGIYHVLDTTSTIVDQLPGIRLHNLYGGTAYNEDGSVKYVPNVFTVSPAFIYEDTGSKSFHQGKISPVCGFDAFLVGDYFWLTIPDVVKGKWNIKMLYTSGSQASLMVIHNDIIITEEVVMSSRDRAWPTWTSLHEKKVGEIEVTERGPVTLYFQVTELKRAPSSCCDILMDMIELSPVIE